MGAAWTVAGDLQRASAGFLRAPAGLAAGQAARVFAAALAVAGIPPPVLLCREGGKGGRGRLERALPVRAQRAEACNDGSCAGRSEQQASALRPQGAVPSK